MPIFNAPIFEMLMDDIILDLRMLWRTKGILLILLCYTMPLITLYEIFFGTPKSYSLSLLLLSLCGLFPVTIFGQSYLGTEYGFWPQRFLTVASLKSFILHKIILLLSLQAVFIFPCLVGVMYWGNNVMALGLIGLTTFSTAYSLYLFSIMSLFNPISFQLMWLRIPPQSRHIILGIILGCAVVLPIVALLNAYEAMANSVTEWFYMIMIGSIFWGLIFFTMVIKRLVNFLFRNRYKLMLKLKLN
jgi:hypothetical protein